MFQFTPLAPLPKRRGDGVHRRRVSPFGHPRITACVRLPEAFRSLPRPSSPIRAKASPVRPSTLDRNFLFGRSRSLHPCLSTLTLSVQQDPNATKHKQHKHRGPCRGAPFFSSPITWMIGMSGVRACARRRLLFSRAFGSTADAAPLLAARKEVIQPQVPLRLPCYDFAPVARLAFDRSAQTAYAARFRHGLRALPTPMA